MVFLFYVHKVFFSQSLSVKKIARLRSISHTPEPEKKVWGKLKINTPFYLQSSALGSTGRIRIMEFCNNFRNTR